VAKVETVAPVAAPATVAKPMEIAEPVQHVEVDQQSGEEVTVTDIPDPIKPVPNSEPMIPALPANMTMIKEHNRRFKATEDKESMDLDNMVGELGTENDTSASSGDQFDK